MAYTNSPLVNYTKLSPNHSGTRTHSIDRITPHCVVGQVTVERLGEIFASTSRGASCNYGIDKDGKLALIVEEKNRSWCTSSNANDQRAVTIEVASDATHPYAMNDKAYNKLIDLCVDICKRNGKTKLLWFADKNKSLNYAPKSNEMVLTAHRWFAPKSCPGDWLFYRLADVAEEVTKRLNGGASATVKPSTSVPKTEVIYRVRKSWDDAKSQKGAFNNIDNAVECADENPGHFVYDETGKVLYPTGLKELGEVNITMQAYTYKWWPAVVNDSDWVGQSDNVAIKYLAVKVDKGTIKAQAYTQKNGWLPALTFGNSYNLKDLNKGVIGDGSPIQALKLDYTSPEGYEEQNVYYCVSDTTGKYFYPEQVDVNVGSGMDGYAGVKGRNIDKIIAHIE